MSRTYRTYTFDLPMVEREDGKAFGRVKHADQTRTRLAQVYVPQWVDQDGTAVKVNTRNVTVTLEADYDIGKADLKLAKADAIAEALAPKAKAKAPVTVAKAKAPKAGAKAPMADTLSDDAKALLAQLMAVLAS
jgi:hypothetical protein